MIDPQKQTNEEIALEIIMKHYNCGFEHAPPVVEEMNDIIKALDAKDAEAQGEIERLRKEISDFRSIDRHKDKDWGKWYKLYHAKVDEIYSLKDEIASLKTSNAKLRELIQENSRQSGFRPSKGYTREDGTQIPEGWHDMGN